MDRDAFQCKKAKLSLNVIKLRKRKKVTGTVKVSVTFIMKIFMNRM